MDEETQFYDKIFPFLKEKGNGCFQVTKRIVAVVIFYYFCWTPQWTLNIMTQFNFIHPSWMTPALSALFFIAHLLVGYGYWSSLVDRLLNRTVESINGPVEI